MPKGHRAVLGIPDEKLPAFQHLWDEGLCDLEWTRLPAIEQIDICRACPVMTLCRQTGRDGQETGDMWGGVMRDPARRQELAMATSKSAEALKKQPKPTTCKHGHAFPDDCRTDKAGRRICPVCAAAREASRKAPRTYESRHSSSSAGGKCVRGHDFDGGGRCPQCNREDARASYDRLKARALANGCTTNHQRAIERAERLAAKEAA